MNPIDELLSHLDGVKSTGKDKWKARCPAHSPDKNPSLSITETNDGTVLVKCWTGCSASEIVHSIGLELKDLFPRPEYTPGKMRKPLFNYKLLLQLLERETTFIFLVADHLNKGEKLCEHDQKRLIESVANLNRIMEVARS